jgi:hypothetical protein
MPASEQTTAKQIDYKTKSKKQTAHIFSTPNLTTNIARNAEEVQSHCLLPCAKVPIKRLPSRVATASHITKEVQ